MIKRFFLCILYIIFSVSISADGIIKINDDDRIYINILSKHLRLLRENKISRLSFDFPEGVFIINKRTNENQVIGSLNIFYKKDKYVLEHDVGRIIGPGEYVCKNISKYNFFNIKVNNFTRQYPLPLNIKLKNSHLDFIISEETRRYCLDSAITELGPVKPEETEALHALYHVILARSKLNKKNSSPGHKNFDFCDLTHCQVYKGHFKNHNYNIETSKWIIDIKNIKGELLFHSRCGGKTMGMKVFNLSYENKDGVKDYLYRFKYHLCKPDNYNWNREVQLKELLSILKVPSYYNPKNTSIMYNRGKCHIRIQNSSENFLIPLESFRLTINRKKGWNYIKSNNYTIEPNKNNSSIIFKGRGLGHCNGLCQHGSLELSRRGYSRYEIIEHYYPWIELKHQEVDPGSTPYLTFCIFDTYSGEILKTNSQSILKRKFPPGSLWKIIVSLYMAKERPDLINNYQYNCKGRSIDGSMPENCWERKGHGPLEFRDALSLSCNLYFASLYKKINKDKFYKFYRGLCRKNNILYYLPEIKNNRDWAHLLSGLDFSISLSTENLIKFCGILNMDRVDDPGVEEFKESVPLNMRMLIKDSLMNTFIKGTGKTSLKRYGDEKNNFSLYGNEENFNNLKKPLRGIWGKTSTMIDGTNKPFSYGVFMGGYDKKGIVVILRKGNGYLASQWGKVLLEDYLSSQQGP